ncbi:MAG: cbb3-type cytochrome oxidase subunit 3 [Myxococcota bacterium]
MNPIYRDAAESAQLGWLLGLVTVQFLLVFVGATLWAWWPSRREDMEAAARLPLEDSP